MASRALPNVGLSGFWTLGEDGWNTGMDLNLLMLSVLVQGVVDSMVGSLPGSPSDGDIHILTSTGNIHVRDSGAWVELDVQEGWRVYDLGTSTTYRFNGTAWESFGEGISSIDGLSDVDLTGVDEGSLLYWDGTSLVNLGIGTAGQVLGTNAGEDAPEWIDPSAGATFASLTDVDVTGVTAGAVLYWDGTDWVDLGVGSTGQVLTVSGGVPSWGTPASSAASISTDSGTSISLTNTHLAGQKIVRCTAATDVTFTIGSGLTGTEPVTVVQSGAGQITFTASSTTLRSADGALKTRIQYAAVTIIPLGSDTYLLIGDLTT